MKKIIGFLSFVIIVLIPSLSISIALESCGQTNVYDNSGQKAKVIINDTSDGKSLYNNKDQEAPVIINQPDEGATINITDSGVVVINPKKKK